jgi:phosphatidylethanolamine-binding protein (PEBP) family uncharacterized protein
MPKAKRRTAAGAAVVAGFLGLEPGATKAQLLQAMEGHVLAEGELVATYER